MELRNVEVRVLQIRTSTPNQPLCHVVCVAAIVFEVVAKACIVATNFLKLCTGSADRLASVLPVLSSVNYVAGISRICNGSG